MSCDCENQNVELCAIQGDTRPIGFLAQNTGDKTPVDFTGKTGVASIYLNAWDPTPAFTLTTAAGTMQLGPIMTVGGNTGGFIGLFTAGLPVMSEATVVVTVNDPLVVPNQHIPAIIGKLTVSRPGV